MISSNDLPTFQIISITQYKSKWLDSLFPHPKKKCEHLFHVYLITLLTNVHLQDTQAEVESENVCI